MTAPLILPPVFLTRLATLIPDEKKDDVYSSLSLPRVSGVRVNTLKASTQDVVAALKKQQITLSPLPWSSDGFVLEEGTRDAIQETDVYKEGKIYFQSLSSQLVPIILCPQENETILDMCASPGSKTSEIAALMKNTGKIIANDRSYQRVFKLKENIRTLGVTNTDILNLPGEMLWKRFPEIFDKVLVDVPCSMEGRFVSGVEKTYKDWSPRKSKMLSRTQKNLLRSALSCTRPGGTIVYSTCTLSVDENEEVINWMLKKYPELTVEKISISLPESIAGFTTYEKKTFHKQLVDTMRILPSHMMEGFYVAKLKKNS